jgi:hypothetical protein
MQKQWCLLQTKVMDLKNMFVYWYKIMGAYLDLLVGFERNTL